MTTPPYPPPAGSQGPTGSQGPAPYQQPGYRPSSHQPDHTYVAPSAQPGHTSYSAQPGHTSGYQTNSHPAGYQYENSGPLTHGGGTPPPSRPVTIWGAAVIEWLGSVALLAGGIAALALRANVDWSPDPQSPPSMFDGLDIVLSGLLVVAGAAAIASAVVLAALTYGAFRGNNACRWTLIILHGLALLPLIPAVVTIVSQQAQTPGQWWLPVLAPAVASVVLIVLWAVPPASHWYRYRAAARAQ